MRISDWSSDVGSSDLIGAGDQLVVLIEQVETILLQRLQLDLEAVAALAGPGDGGIQLAMTEHEPAQQCLDLFSDTGQVAGRRCRMLHALVYRLAVGMALRVPFVVARVGFGYKRGIGKASGWERGCT